MPNPAPSVPDAQPPVGSLTTPQAAAQRVLFGKNEIRSERGNPIWLSVRNVVTEPMFILLAVACGLYFLLGDTTEAIMMVLSILFVASIEMYQETKSERALEALRRYTQAQVRVLRDGTWGYIDSEDLVPDDFVSLEEGERVPADGILLEQHDLTVDESVLTGESLPVEKWVSASTGDRMPAEGQVFQGTTVASGKGLFRITATGERTAFGALGKSIETIESAPTPLQGQIKRFVRNMGIVGALAFVVVFALNYWVENDIWKALLFSLTLAMAILPEEIPVAFSAFMGLGAFRMIRHGILAKQPSTVESLGSATVICLDKTGTITENRMSVAEVVDLAGQGHTLQYAAWASEPEPFDAMEKAVLQALPDSHLRDGYSLVKEYPLSGKPPMMTHIWENTNGQRVMASKGAVERMLDVAEVSAGQAVEQVLEQTETLAAQGYRVLAVASAVYTGDNFPAHQEDLPWKLEGLVAFYDPPKENAAEVFEKFHRAGIRVMMITGDHVSTARNIASHTGLRGWQHALTGHQVMQMDETRLQEAVKEVNVFARMFPDAKLRVVEALKAQGETVAMSGDGVNDGPALKAAQIGVAMGEKGTEIAKSAASLVLLNDDLAAMPQAIEMGRRIYDNLRKAIRYIISIHLPIVLVVLVPLLLGWPYTHILLPLHVIFLELVMDPTAAVAFENEPAERHLMKKPPRRADTSLFSWKELGVSLLQGLLITVAVLAMYQFALIAGKSEAGVRSFVFATLVSSNLFLTLANRSFEYALHRTLFYRNRMLPAIMATSLAMMLVILYVPFFTDLFRMQPLSLRELGACMLAGFGGVVWFEVYKVIRELRGTASTDAKHE